MKYHESEAIVNDEGLDVSVVLPCLNKAKTLTNCIHEIHEAFRQSGLRGEIIVANNDSVDGSVSIANSSQGQRSFTLHLRATESLITAFK